MADYLNNIKQKLHEHTFKKELEKKEKEKTKQEEKKSKKEKRRVKCGML